MTAATVHYLPGVLDGDQDHADDIAALVEELGRLAILVDEARHAALTASASADAASAARLDYWADGYRAGFEAGREVGYGQAVHDWKVTARNTGMYDVGQHGTAYAEQDARRYPSMTPGVPAGRVGWLTGTLGALYTSWSDHCAEGGE